MSKADAENRQFAINQLLDRWHSIFTGGSRIARAVRKEDAVWIIGQYIFCSSGCRQNCDLRAEAGKQTQNVTLYAEVECYDMILVVGLFAIAFAQRPRGLVPGQALTDGDIFC